MLGVVGVGALAVLGPAVSELLTAAAELGLPTDAVLFDVENDPPALLQPGTAVRFVSVA